jgi:hypothetical protein
VCQGSVLSLEHAVIVTIFDSCFVIARKPELSCYHVLNLIFLFRQGLDRKNVRFMYDGNALQDDNTPEKLEMDNDDVIDVMQAQTGGSQ